MTTLVFADFDVAQDDRDRISAGQAALRRAQSFGYGRALQTSLMRRAKREHVPGVDPEITARNVVPCPPQSATVRGYQPPRGAA